MTAPDRVEPPAKPSVVYSCGQVFPDGLVLELIRIPDQEPRLLVKDGDSTKVVSELIRRNNSYLPLRLDPSVRLPTHAQAYGSTRDLFSSIAELILRLTALSEDVVRPLTFFAIGTWLADFLPFAPYIWISTPPTSSPASLVQVLGLLCRRAIVIGDLAPMTFRTLPVDLRPTLLADVFQPTRRVLSLLRASNRNSAFFAPGGLPVNTYCSKLVFAPEPPPDSRLVGSPLELTLSPPSKYSPILSSAEAERIAEEYQAKLLQYRLTNCLKVHAPVFAMDDLTVPMQNLAYSMGAPIVGDDELQAEVKAVLQPIDAEIRVGVASLLQSIVLEALLARCHSEASQEFAVMDLTADVNTILSGRGEASTASPEAVGWKLRNLGFLTEPVQGGRKGLVLTQEIQKKVHDLSFAYGVRSMQVSTQKVSCSECARLGRPVSRADENQLQ